MDGGYITRGHFDVYSDPLAREIAAATDRLAR
jgi:hypothetical protein